MNIIKDLITVNNFGIGRKGWEPDRITIHITEGTAKSTDSWFENDDSDVSSHYHIDKKAEVKQYVLEKDSAWANGRVFNPTAKIVKERVNVNPNYYTISIEHEGSGLEDLTDVQRNASAWLINDIRSRFPKIQLNQDYIIPHRNIYAKKTCPGKIDVAKLIKLAGQLESTKTMARPKVVWSDYFNDYLVITKYVSDTEWYFMPIKKIQNPLKAQTPLSQMEDEPS